MTDPVIISDDLDQVHFAHVRTVDALRWSRDITRAEANARAAGDLDDPVAVGAWSHHGGRAAGVNYSPGFARAQYEQARAFIAQNDGVHGVEVGSQEMDYWQGYAIAERLSIRALWSVLGLR